MAWVRRSAIFAPVMRESPQDAPLASQKLLLRAGFVRKGEGAGLFCLLPLGMRVMSKISQIVDEGMESIAAQRLSMPSLMSSQP
jgi:prolyl-tRNA synthetase